MQREALPGSFELVSIRCGFGHEPLSKPRHERGDRGPQAATPTSAAAPTARTTTPTTPASWSSTSRTRRTRSSPARWARRTRASRGESSRELRVWRSQEILIVLHTNCGGNDRARVLGRRAAARFKFYDIAGENADEPEAAATRTRSTRTSSSSGRTRPTRSARCCSPPARAASLQIYDLSPLLEGRGQEPGTRAAPVRTFNGAHGFGNSSGSGIHSFSVSNDGKRLYFALLTRGFGVADFSDFTDNDPATNTYRLITPAANRVALARPGRAQRGQALEPGLGLRLRRGLRHDHRRRPRLPVGLDALRRHRRRDAAGGPQRVPAAGEPAAVVHERSTRRRTSYSAHNPTLTPSIAFSTWHSGGFQAIDMTNPTNADPARRVQAEAAARWSARRGSAALADDATTTAGRPRPTTRS